MVKSTVEFWFKDRHNLYLQLPVNPESISISSPFSINTVNIASLGEVAIPGERGLKTISFSSFFPRDYNSTYCEYEGGITPEKWVEIMERWRDDRRNIRLIIGGTSISIPVFVSSFTIEPEKAGHPGDIYFSIELIEYRPVQARIIQPKQKATQSQSKAAQRPKSEKTLSKSYVVKQDDCLWKISKVYYGNGAQWRRIYDVNKKVIGKNPHLIYPGQKLVIPQ